MDKLSSEKISSAESPGKDQRSFEILGYIMDSNQQEETLRFLAGEMHRHGIVTEEYGTAVYEREKEFPTGLPTSPVCVAIPHSDKKYAFRSAIAIARLKNPVVFKNMGAPDEELNIELVLLLAVPPEADQVLMIQTIIEVVQDEEALISLAEATTGEDLIQNLQKRIKTQPE